MAGYIHRILVAFDQLCNVAFFLGYPDETISAHAYRASLLGHRWGIVLCWFLDKIERNHGKLAAEGDLARSETVETEEEKSLKVEDEDGKH